MEELNTQVKRAHRRLLTEQFLHAYMWSLFGCLIVCTVGLAITKIWALPVDLEIWKWSWVGGSLLGSFLIAGLATYFRRRNHLEAALEIDRRFGLKERISSSLALPPEQLDTEVGQALVADAVRRVERIDVRDKFQVGLHPRSWVVLIPALALAAMFLLSDATPKLEASTSITPDAKKELAKSAERLKKKLEDSKKLAAKGLKEGDLDAIKKVEEELNELSKDKNLKRKEALLKINDLASKIKERKDQLGGAEQMRKQFERLKNLEKGPADKIADAMKDGDFKKAIDELQKLQEKMLNNELNPKQQEQMAKQMDQLQKKLEKMVDAQKQAQRDLKKMIDEARKAGDLQKAADLQKKLEQVQNQQQQMDQLEDLAQKMGECKNCMKQGNMADAADQLQKMADQMQAMQNELDQMEVLDELLDELADAREACAQCDGEGQGQPRMGQGGNNQQQRMGMGMGPGQGAGDRPEEQEDTKFYKSKVGAKAERGEAVIKGKAYGPNRAGRTRESVKEMVEANLAEEAAPIEDQHLPKNQREQAQQYFNQFNN